MKKYFLCLAVAILMLAGISALAEPSIPVVSLDGDCLIDYTNWNDKSTYYPATLSFSDGETSFAKEIEIKPQGTSSLFAPKKNFTVKFAEGIEFVDSWGAQEKYVLKADYIDPTRSGNVVSAKLAAEMNQKYGVLVDTPNYGVIDGFPVWVKINGEDAGIFNLTIPKDAWMFGMDENDPNHLVLACEGWSAASRMQSADIDYEADWSFEVGEPTDESKAAFERMVEFVSTADDATFVADFDQYFDLDACLNYLCYVNIAYGIDNVAKNMLMATYDGKVWYPVLYDLDSLWGIGYDGIAAVKVDAQWWMNDLLSNSNHLLYRVNQLFGDQVRERYWELRKGILSKEHIMESFEAYAARIPQEYYEIDHALWNADGSHIRTLELMSQLMDEYLPAIDAHFKSAATAPFAAMVDGPAIHYVWEKDGVQLSDEDIEALPVSMTLSYTLDGNVISVQELAGKSGHLEATLRVERKAEAEHVYGVAALMHVEEAQCENITVTGGTYENAAQEYVCMGSAWLGGTQNSYEMQLSMDVTAFDPAGYMVAVSPVHVDGGGDDGSLKALLATAGELTGIINDGLSLHESMIKWHDILSKVLNSLTATGASVQELLPSDAETEQEDAAGIMQTLLADAEADADALLTAFGYELAADAATADRVQMLSEAAADAKRTEAEKAQAAAQLGLIENYMAVVAELEETQLALGEIDEALTEITTTLPDLVNAYAYANDQLYALLYRMSTLYQDLANYYYANHGGGDAYDFAEFGDWYDVIVFSNYEGIAAH